jgi:acetyltransferase
MIRFHQTLSDQTVYFRYFAMIRLSQRISHERLSRICFVDYDREIALVAIKDDEIVAVGRISSLRGTAEVEFAVVVNDRFQRQGWGTRILTHLIEVARAEGRSAVVGDVLLENRGMQRVCRKVGFVLNTNIADGVVRAVYKL